MTETEKDDQNATENVTENVIESGNHQDKESEEPPLKKRKQPNPEKSHVEEEQEDDSMADVIESVQEVSIISGVTLRSFYGHFLCRPASIYDDFLSSSGSLTKTDLCPTWFLYFSLSRPHRMSRPVRITVATTSNSFWGSYCWRLELDCKVGNSGVSFYTV